MKTTDYQIYQPVPKTQRGANVGTVVAADLADAIRQCDQLYGAGTYTLRDDTDEIVHALEE